MMEQRLAELCLLAVGKLLENIKMPLVRVECDAGMNKMDVQMKDCADEYSLLTMESVVSRNSASLIASSSLGGFVWIRDLYLAFDVNPPKSGVLGDLERGTNFARE